MHDRGVVIRQKPPKSATPQGTQPSENDTLESKYCSGGVSPRKIN